MTTEAMAGQKNPEVYNLNISASGGGHLLIILFFLATGWEVIFNAQGHNLLAQARGHKGDHMQKSKVKQVLLELENSVE